MDSTTIERIRGFVQEALADGHPQGRITFGPIAVRRTLDADDGSPYFCIVIVFDGSKENLNIRWFSSLPRRLLLRFSEVGIEEYPNLSYVSREE